MLFVGKIKNRHQSTKKNGGGASGAAEASAVDGAANEPTGEAEKNDDGRV